MQKLLLFLGLLAAPAVWAGGIASDTASEPPTRPAGNIDLRPQALEFYIRAMMEKDPAKRLPDLLKSLELDPDAAMPLQMILEIRRAQKPPLNIQAAEGLLAIAEKHPRNLRLNALAVRSALGIHPKLQEQAKKAAANAIAMAEDTRPDRAYLELLGLHLQDLLEQEKFEEARELLAGAIDRSDPPEALLYEWTADICRRAARVAPAERRWLGLLASEKELWLDRHREAVSAVRLTDPDLADFPAVEQRVRFYLRMRCPADALRMAESAVKKFPGNTDGAYLQVTTLLRLRRYQEAYKLAGKLVKVSPVSPQCLRLLAESALRCGEYTQALQTGRKLLAVEKKENSRFFIVTALILAQKWDEAQKEIALVKNPEFLLSLTSMLQARQKNWDTYLARLRKLQKNPNYKGGDAVYITMLPIAEQTRDVKLLDECWQNMEKLGSLKDPGNANNVGYVAAALNHRLEEAGKLIKFALESEPDNGAYMDSMAWYLYRIGDYHQAWEYIQKSLEAMEDEPSFGVACDHAGDIALKLGKKEAALDYYRQALGDYLAPDLDLQAVLQKIRRLTSEKKEK